MPSLNPVALSKFLNLSKFPFPTCKTWMIIAATTHSAMRLKQAFSSVQFSHLVVSDSLRTPRTAAHQASLTITNSRSLLKLMSVESVMPSIHLILCRPLLLPASIFPSIRGFSSESVLRIRWPNYWSFNFSISPSNEYSGLISFRIDWFDLLQSKGLSRGFSNKHSSKASILQHSAFFIVQLSHQ